MQNKLTSVPARNLAYFDACEIRHSILRGDTPQKMRDRLTFRAPSSPPRASEVEDKRQALLEKQIRQFVRDNRDLCKRTLQLQVQQRFASQIDPKNPKATIRWMNEIIDSTLPEPKRRASTPPPRRPESGRLAPDSARRLTQALSLLDRKAALESALKADEHAKEKGLRSVVGLEWTAAEVLEAAKRYQSPVRRRPPSPPKTDPHYSFAQTVKFSPEGTVRGSGPNFSHSRATRLDVQQFRLAQFYPEAVVTVAAASRAHIIATTEHLTRQGMSLELMLRSLVTRFNPEEVTGARMAIIETRAQALCERLASGIIRDYDEKPDVQINRMIATLRSIDPDGTEFEIPDILALINHAFRITQMRMYKRVIHLADQVRINDEELLEKGEKEKWYQPLNEPELKRHFSEHIQHGLDHFRSDPVVNRALSKLTISHSQSASSVSSDCPQHPEPIPLHETDEEVVPSAQHEHEAIPEDSTESVLPPVDQSEVAPPDSKPESSPKASGSSLKGGLKNTLKWLASPITWAAKKLSPSHPAETHRPQTPPRHAPHTKQPDSLPLPPATDEVEKAASADEESPHPSENSAPLDFSMLSVAPPDSLPKASASRSRFICWIEHIPLLRRLIKKTIYGIESPSSSANSSRASTPERKRPPDLLDTLSSSLRHKSFSQSSVASQDSVSRTPDAHRQIRMLVEKYTRQGYTKEKILSLLKTHRNLHARLDPSNFDTSILITQTRIKTLIESLANFIRRETRQGRHPHEIDRACRDYLMQTTDQDFTPPVDAPESTLPIIAECDESKIRAMLTVAHALATQTPSHKLSSGKSINVQFHEALKDTPKMPERRYSRSSGEERPHYDFTGPPPKKILEASESERTPTHTVEETPPDALANEDADPR